MASYEREPAFVILDIDDTCAGFIETGCDLLARATAGDENCGIGVTVMAGGAERA